MTKEVKEYLGKIYRTNEFINAKECEISQLRDLSVKTTMVFNGSGVKNKSHENKKELIICKIVDLEQTLLDDINNVVDLSREIYDIIERVKDPDYRLLLEYRYLIGLTWDSIAEKMGFTTQWINVLHKRALNEVESIMSIY